MATISEQRRIDALLDEWEPRMREAFMEAIDGILSSLSAKEVIDLLESGDIESVVNMASTEEDDLGAVEFALMAVLFASGISAAKGIRLTDPSGRAVRVSFGIRNPQAEQWLRDKSATLIQGISEDSRSTIRSVLTESLERGDNPRRAATILMGKVSKATKKRQGGIIGLSKPQAEYVMSARQELASGDPNSMKNYLKRTKRDKRYDPTVRKAIREGKPVTQANIDKITGRYADRLLRLRAQTIAFNETMSAINYSKMMAWRKAIQQGDVDSLDLVKVWRHTPQEHPRLQHIAMDKKEVPFDQPFKMPDGTDIDYPHAPGIPMRHKIGCKCTWLVKVDFVEAEKRRGNG